MTAGKAQDESCRWWTTKEYPIIIIDAPQFPRHTHKVVRVPDEYGFSGHVFRFHEDDDDATDNAITILSHIMEELLQQRILLNIWEVNDALNEADSTVINFGRLVVQSIGMKGTLWKKFFKEIENRALMSNTDLTAMRHGAPSAEDAFVNRNHRDLYEGQKIHCFGLELYSLPSNLPIARP